MFYGHSGCWQNMVPCGYGTELSFFAVSCGLIPASQSFPGSLVHGHLPPSSKLAMAGGVLLTL